MKAFLCAVFCLTSGISHGEESSRAEWLRDAMEFYGWNTEEVTFQVIGKMVQPVIIKRAGDVVGYYLIESVWERRDVASPDLDGVTKIVFGGAHPKEPVFFQIEDKGKIAMWIAAYRNHTEFERRFACFIPTAKSSGFTKKREECQFGEVCLCSLALRFFVDDKQVLELKGHIQEDSVIGSGTRNLVLHELAKAELPKAATGESDKVEPAAVDPFAETPE